jgi:DNA repair protein RecO (recombination protein O)
MPRQRVYRTPAIVLKRMDLGEADRILTFYSRDHGKVRAVAKGIRRGTSRSAGHLEPFTVTDVLFAVGRELDVVSQADTLEAFRQLREDLVLTTHAYYLVEVVDLLTEEREENRAVFDLLVDGFRELGESADHRQVLICFHLRLMDALGYRPELRECVGCHAAIAPDRNRFSPQQGGALCPPCGVQDSAARQIGVPALKLLRYLQQGGQSVQASPHVTREAEALLRDYAEHIVERRLRTPALIARVSEMSAEKEAPKATI